MSVEPNEHPSSMFLPKYRIERHAPKLINYAERIPIADERYPPNAERFELINKSPAIHTAVKKLPNLNLDKYTSRDQSPRQKITNGGDDYVAAVKVKEKMMYSNIGRGVSMGVSPGRTMHNGIYKRP